MSCIHAEIWIFVRRSRGGSQLNRDEGMRTEGEGREAEGR